MAAPDHDTVIIGAGFSGIGTAILLDKAGMGDYLLIEAADGCGGTWHWNTYPGIAVDIPSFSYQFSFEQSADWTRTYAPGRELKAYAEHCVDKYGLRPKIRFNTKVLSAVFDDESDLWTIETDSGETVTARFLVNAGGVLTTPQLPDIDGVDSFAGVTMHTARWDHGSGPRGQARRDHRHRRVRRPGHPRDRADRRAPHRFSAHADLVLPEGGRAAVPRRPSGDAPSRRQGRATPAQPGLRRTDVSACRAVLHGQPDGQARAGIRQGLSPQGRSRIPSCGTS